MTDEQKPADANQPQARPFRKTVTVRRGGTRTIPATQDQQNEVAPDADQS